MDSSDEDLDYTPYPVKGSSSNSNENNIIPELSKERYLKEYDNFIKWKTEENQNSFSEKVFMRYFKMLATKLSPPTVLNTFSIMKVMVLNKLKIDLKQYEKLLRYVKGQAVGYKVKKTKVFTPHDIETFLSEASDEIHLVTKVALIFGISGGCKMHDIVNMKIQDVQRYDKFFVINLPASKKKVDRSFIVREEYTNYVQKYLDLRPDKLDTNRFFLNYCNGKCTRQVIGRNKMAAWPRRIATYLKLLDPDSYTGYCFQRTARMLQAYSGANLSMIKKMSIMSNSAARGGSLGPSAVKANDSSETATEFVEIPPISHSTPGKQDNDSILEDQACSSSSYLGGSKLSDDSNDEDEFEQKPNIGNSDEGEGEPSHVTFSQNLRKTIHVAGKPISLTLNNCSNCTIHFH